MKQRVAIARAFAIHPEVLLLDEPFGALDALTKASLHEELIELLEMDNQTDTVVIVTHDIEEAIFLSDRIVVMTNGPEATIGEIIDVPIPRPRDKREIVHLHGIRRGSRPLALPADGRLRGAQEVSGVAQTASRRCNHRNQPRFLVARRNLGLDSIRNSPTLASGDTSVVLWRDLCLSTT